jgi:hypothetical protein
MSSSKKSVSWLPDGVFHMTADGQLQLQYLPPPTNDDVKALLLRIRTRVLKVVAKYDDSIPDDDQMALVNAQHEACRPPLFTIPYTDDELKRPLCASKDGFSLHADLSIHQKKERNSKSCSATGSGRPLPRSVCPCWLTAACGSSSASRSTPARPTSSSSR